MTENPFSAGDMLVFKGDDSIYLFRSVIEQDGETLAMLQVMSEDTIVNTPLEEVVHGGILLGNMFRLGGEPHD